MLTIAYYFLQVVLCSGLMMGYYWLVLRNKRFHQYNRFYLLAIALLSWIVPLIKITWNSSHTTAMQQPQVMQFLSVVADSNSQIEQAISTKGFEWSWNYLAIGVYVLVSLVLLAGMIRALIRVYQLLKIHSCKNVGDVYLILTQAKGTPFSFFRYIFWNDEIDIRSESGKQILQHELTHVQQKHSFDKLLIQLILIAGWFNPFFWLLRREMDMIHEFIADKKAVSNGDTASLAQMLLTAAYPQQKFALTHPFFFSPIKRRLQMLTNTKNPRFSYIRRLIVLPLLAIVVVLFAFRNKEQRTNTTLSLATVMENVKDEIIGEGSGDRKKTITIFNQAILDKTYTVVIDAGHGGTDKGVTGVDGTTESMLTLQLAKAIKKNNTNENIRIVLTRDADVFRPVTQTAGIVNEQHPDLFVSLHCNESAASKIVGTKGVPLTGIEIYVPSKETAADYDGSIMLANMISGSMKGLDTKMLGIRSRKQGIYLLKNVQSPAVLIETGFIDNKTDLEKLKDASYQNEMAQSILQGINYYLSKQPTVSSVELKGDTIVKGPEKVKEFAANISVRNTVPDNTPLFIIDGKRYDNLALNLIDPNAIASIDVLKNETATLLYGEEGKNGVIIMTTKARQSEFNTNGTAKYGIQSFKNSPINTALVMIDGVKMDPDFIHLLDPKKIASVSILKDESALAMYGNEGKNGVILITTKDVFASQRQYPGNPFSADSVNISPASQNISVTGYGNYGKPNKIRLTPAQYTGYPTGGVNNLNEVTVIDYDDNDNAGIKDFKKRNPTVNDVRWKQNPSRMVVTLKDGTEESYDLSKPESKQRAVNKYGKLPVVPPSPPTEQVVVENIKLENISTGAIQKPAAFPGGNVAWEKFLMRNLDRTIVKKNGGPPGKYTVQLTFVVDETGAISNIKTLNDPGYGTKNEAIRMIAKGPKWIPATSGGKNVSSIQKQAIAFVVMDN